MTAPRVAFLVVRAGLAVSEWDPRSPSIWDESHYQGLGEADNGPVRVPEAVLLDRDAAERERGRRERAAREVLNPFWLADTSDLLPEEEFRARVRALGLVPAPVVGNLGQRSAWSAWWDEESPNWTAERRAAVWELFDKVRLFEVVEVALE